VAPPGRRRAHVRRGEDLVHAFRDARRIPGDQPEVVGRGRLEAGQRALELSPASTRAHGLRFCQIAIRRGGPPLEVGSGCLAVRGDRSLHIGGARAEVACQLGYRLRRGAGFVADDDVPAVRWQDEGGDHIAIEGGVAAAQRDRHSGRRRVDQGQPVSEGALVHPVGVGHSRGRGSDRNVVIWLGLDRGRPGVGSEKGEQVVAPRCP
jgi:hypothetical protein